MPKKTSPRRKKENPNRKVTKRPGRTKDPAAKPKPDAGAENSQAEAPPSPEPLPFDREFFRTQFPHLISEEPGKPRTPSCYVVTVTLGDGMTHLDVSHIEQLEEQWVVFAVCDAANYRESSVANRYVFVPYGAIARIEVTGIERRIGAIGFHRTPASAPTGRADASPTKRPATRRTKKKTKKPAPKRPTRRIAAAGAQSAPKRD